MIVSIHQPTFCPWLGFFHKWKKSDTFVLLDNCQFEKQDYQHRCRIINNGNPDWVSLAIQGSKLKSLNEIDVLETHKTALKLKGLYGWTKHTDVLDEICNIIKTNTKLVNIDILCLKYLGSRLGITTPLILSSEMAYDKSLRKNDRNLAICKELHATKYVSGTGARDYNDEAAYTAAGIALEYQNYKHFEYSQRRTDKFHEGLSVLDVILSTSAEEAAAWIAM